MSLMVHMVAELLPYALGACGSVATPRGVDLVAVPLRPGQGHLGDRFLPRRCRDSAALLRLVCHRSGAHGIRLGPAPGGVQRSVAVSDSKVAPSWAKTTLAGSN